MNNCDIFKVCGLCQGRIFLMLAPHIKTCLATLMVTAMKIKVHLVKMKNFYMTTLYGIRRILKV
jgi:hypothetical protein